MWRSDEFQVDFQSNTTYNLLVSKCNQSADMQLNTSNQEMIYNMTNEDRRIDNLNKY